MEKVTQLLLLVLAIFLVVLSSDVEGGRSIKTKEKVDHPQTIPGLGFPSPGFVGGSFPSPGFVGGSFPTPGFGSIGSFPGPGLGGSSGFGNTPSSFCSLPGVHCEAVQPTFPGGSLGGSGSGSP